MISERYNEVWKNFLVELEKFNEEIIKDIRNDKIKIDECHDALVKMYDVPKRELTEYLKARQGKDFHPNVGSVTGIFFEIIVYTFIKGYLEKRFPNVVIERNYCSDKDIKAIARDPDFHISRNGKHLIVETKVAPKKRDINVVKRYKIKYDNIGVNYYLVGGWVSLNKNVLEELKNVRWICFLDGYQKDKILKDSTTFDDLLKDMYGFLR